MSVVIDAIIRLRDRFTPDLQHIQNQLQETRNISRRAARDMQSLGDSISGIGTAMLPVAGAIAGGIGVATKQFADFDYTITQAGLKAGATKKQFAEMSDTVIAAGAKYPISIQSAAEAMDRLAAGGFNAEQSMGALSPVIQAAVASGEDMAVVSDVVTSALSTWGLMEGDVAKNAEMVADVVQMASNKSKLGVQEIKTALQYAAAPASALGDNLQTVTAILGTMANKGIEASTAGTSLRTAYLNLTAGSKPALEAIEKLNLEVFDSEGKFKGMTAMMNQLREKMAGMSEQERTPLLRDIFGTEGISAVLAVLNTTQKEFDEMLASMNNATGSSAEAFEKMNSTFKGQIMATQGAFEALTIRIGKAAAPMLKPLVQGFQQFVQKLNEMPDEKIQQILRLGMGFVGLTGGILALGKGISFVGSLAGFLNPLGTSLAQGATLSTMFASRLAAVTTSLNTIKNVGILVFSQVGKAISSAFGFLFKFPFSIVANIGRSFITVFQAFRSVGSIQGVFALLTHGIRALSAAFLSNPIGIALLAIGAAAIIVANNWDLFKNVAEVVWNKISYIVGQVVNTLKATFGNLATSARVHFGRLTELWNKVTGDSHTSGELITKVINTLGSVFTAGFGLIAGVVELAFAQIGTIINAFMGVGEGVITFLTGVFTGNWGMAWDGIKRIVMSVVGGIIETVENMVATIEDAVARIRGMEGTAMKNLQTRRQIAQTKELRDQAVSSGKASKGSIEAFDKQSPDYIPGENALGTNFWRGGLTWVHEQGPEIIDLPTGTRVIPHSKSLMQEYRRGISDGLSMAPSAFLSPGIAPGNVSNSDTAGATPQRDELGNAQEKAYAETAPSGREYQQGRAGNPQQSPTRPGEGAGLPQSIFQGLRDGQEEKGPSRAADGARKPIEVFAPTPQRDELGNITGANIPEYNRITPDDTEEVKAAKQKAQEKAYMQTAPLGEQEKPGAAETATRTHAGAGNPQSNIKGGEQPKPVQPITFNINIPKLADALYVREKADINDITRQLVFQIRGMAMNRIQGAVR